MKDSKKIIQRAAIFLLLFCIGEVWAKTSGGGLPFDTWFTKIEKSITGPFAFITSIFSIIGTGSALIFGGQINDFLKGIIFLVLVLSFVIAAENVLTTITGQGMLLPKTLVELHHGG